MNCRVGLRWEALWLEVERDGQAEVPYSEALTFTLLARFLSFRQCAALRAVRKISSGKRFIPAGPWSLAWSRKESRGGSLERARHTWGHAACTRTCSLAAGIPFGLHAIETLESILNTMEIL